MSSTYTQFCFSFKVSISGAKWITKILTKADALKGSPLDDADMIKMWPNWRECPATGFNWDLNDAKDSTSKVICIYSDESGDLESVANFLQFYLAKFDPKARIGFTYSDTCDSMRVDEFGGGAVAVSARGVKWHNANDWLSSHVDAPFSPESKD